MFLRILNDLDNAYDLLNVGRSEEDGGKRKRSDEESENRGKKKRTHFVD